MILFAYATPQSRILMNLSVRFIHNDEVAFASDFRMDYI